MGCRLATTPESEPLWRLQLLRVELASRPSSSPEAVEERHVSKVRLVKKNTRDVTREMKHQHQFRQRLLPEDKSTTLCYYSTKAPGTMLGDEHSDHTEPVQPVQMAQADRLDNFLTVTIMRKSIVC
ncbi:hypothetical protein F2P81_024396 [Scophthalmus maximus]|uniref:Uncharacterized protein n=1 Tax=Scophthalmus maximus TaxID=52904 RepID=A0A6A4RML6_SCOMX|nr:hypothetical protein F2P81_024396 [Scophthalmus maximus]